MGSKAVGIRDQKAGALVTDRRGHVGIIETWNEISVMVRWWDKEAGAFELQPAATVRSELFLGGVVSFTPAANGEANE